MASRLLPFLPAPWCTSRWPRWPSPSAWATATPTGWLWNASAARTSAWWSWTGVWLTTTYQMLCSTLSRGARKSSYQTIKVRAFVMFAHISLKYDTAQIYLLYSYSKWYSKNCSCWTAAREECFLLLLPRVSTSASHNRSWGDSYAILAAVFHYQT